VEDNPVLKDPSVTALAAGGSGSTVVMQTLEVEIRGLEGVVKANVLFDSGSGRSYIASNLVRKMKSEFVSYCAFGSSKPKNLGISTPWS